MDEIENIDAAKPLMVEIAMQMAMSDGSLDQSEGDVIKKWIKKEIDLASDSKKENIKKLSDAADITKLLNLLKSVNNIKLISNKPINKDISFDNLMVEYRNIFK